MRIEIHAGSVSHDLVKTIRKNRIAGVPTLVFGPPGVGKSQQVHQAAHPDPVIDVRLSMLDPVDLRGLPIVSEGRVTWARPDFLPDDGRGILLFDELNTAAVAVQNAALQLILDRRCGPHRLGDGWYIVACGNRASHRAHVSPLSSALRNRFAVVDYEPTVERWTRWAYEQCIHPHVIAFLSFSPSSLVSDPVDEYGNFASPRAWERVSQFINSGIEDVDALTSLVGRGCAVAFCAYRDEIQSMPDLDQLLAGESEWCADPAQLSITFALAVGLAGRLLQWERGEPPKVIVERACGIAAAMPAEIACLFFIPCINGSESLRAAVMRSRGVVDFYTTHSKLVNRYGGALAALGESRRGGA